MAGVFQAPIIWGGGGSTGESSLFHHLLAAFICFRSSHVLVGLGSGLRLGVDLGPHFTNPINIGSGADPFIHHVKASRSRPRTFSTFLGLPLSGVRQSAGPWPGGGGHVVVLFLSLDVHIILA